MGQTKDLDKLYQQYDGLRTEIDDFVKLHPEYKTQVHHLVEQCQQKATRSGFSPDLIYNSKNEITLPTEFHTKISAKYSSLVDGKVLRNAMNGKSIYLQTKKGLEVLKDLWSMWRTGK